MRRPVSLPVMALTLVLVGTAPAGWAADAVPPATQADAVAEPAPAPAQAPRGGSDNVGGVAVGVGLGMLVGFALLIAVAGS